VHPDYHQQQQQPRRHLTEEQAAEAERRERERRYITFLVADTEEWRHIDALMQQYMTLSEQ